MRKLALLGLGLLLAACSSESTSNTQSTPASNPVLKDLAYQPNEIKVGAASTVSGTFTFDDPEGDLFQMASEVRAANGQVTTLPRTEIQNTSGSKTGQLQFALMLQVPSAQKLDFTIWVVDKAGHESNKLNGSIDVK